MFAIENTHVKCVEALLTLTAYDLEDEFEEFAEGTQQLNVNAADTDGRTALTYARTRIHAAIVALLKARGAPE